LKLREKDQVKNACVFLNDKGCSIYENRPTVCRNYPTGLATQNPQEGQGSHPYFIIEEEMCKGHAEKKRWTIAEWKDNQGSTELDELNKSWLEIVARLKSLTIKDDQDQKMNTFVLVSFDQDTFRDFVFKSSFLKRFEVSQSTAELIRVDDEELLKFGIKWLEYALFAEGPVRPRK
jgi:hypothetical protein